MVVTVAPKSSTGTILEILPSRVVEVVAMMLLPWWLSVAPSTKFIWPPEPENWVVPMDSEFT